MLLALTRQRPSFSGVFIVSSARRTFLKQAGLGAAAFAALPTSVSATEPNDASSASVWREQVHALAHEPQQQAIVWDTTWAKRITGKHKAMFDVPEIEGGVGVLRSGIWQMQYKEVLKVQQSDLSAVMVIRHTGIVLAMNQEYWVNYEVGKKGKLKGDDGKTMKYNPVLPVPGGPAPQGMFASLMLDKQLENGALALACNLAFRSVVSAVQEKDKLSPAEARTKAMSMLVPGVILQPSGIFANVMAEEAGCTFVQAV